MADVLMAFLGATDYRTYRYRFSDLEGAAVTARYAATATMCYLKRECGINVGRLIVAGTVSSFWDKLPEYLSEKAEDMLAGASGAENARTVLDSEKTKEICADLAACRQRKADAASFPELLARLEQELNAAFKPAGLAVSLLEHPEDFSRYESQLDLLNSIQDLNVIKSGSTVHLDITNGLRIMPFAVFADFQCLCRISGFRIGKVFYLPEPKFPTEPVERLDALESVKARLRALKQRDPAAYQEKLAGIKTILDAAKGPSGAKTTAAGPIESRVCTLDISEELLDDAFMMEQFKVSADPAVFCPALKNSENKPDLQNRLKDLSYQLNTGLYADAADLADEHEQAILDALCNPEISTMLKNFLSWTYDFDPNDYLKAAAALKKLTANYLNCDNYPQAINSLYYAVYNFEHPSTTGDVHDQLQKESIHSHYASAIDKFKTFREMLIHLSDIDEKSNKKFNPEHKKLLKAVKSKDGLIDTDDLPQKLKNNLKMFGIKKVLSPDHNERRHTLVTFIGSGEYGIGNYSYFNPFHPEDRDYDITGSKMIGISLAARMRENEGEHLSKVLICGTWTSNWRIVMKTLEREFLSLMPANRQGEFIQLENSIVIRQNTAVDAAISHENVDCFNRFFESVARDIGCRFVMVVTSADIADAAGQHQMLDAIRNELTCGDLLSFDITHSYRIIPVLALCFAQYFHAVIAKRFCPRFVFSSCQRSSKI
ncbi:MAG: hypothetical protein IJ523_09510 [Succinivibrionaceae bacterium]|nr:hypothetical protein [Succinivibrionaceae bacterium]